MALLDVPATLRAVPPATPTPAQPAPAALGSVFTAPRTDGTASVILGGVTTDGMFAVEALDPDGHDPDAAGMYRVEFRLLQTDNAVIMASYADAADLVADPPRAVARIVDEARNPARVWNRAIDELERLIRGLYTTELSRAGARNIIRTLHRPTADGVPSFRCEGDGTTCPGGYLAEVGPRLRHLDTCDACITDGPLDRLKCPDRKANHPAWTAWAWCRPEAQRCEHDHCIGLGYVHVAPAADAAQPGDGARVEACRTGKPLCCGCCYGDPELG